MSPIADVIKYEGDNSTFIWKHPREDFNIFSQLVVHESQEAILFMDGQALDQFGPGRYTLETKNIPLLGKVLNLFMGNESPFHCEVYFINKTEQMSVKWGTDSRVEYMEPTYGFPLSIGASGEMALRVKDSKKLLLKLVGTESILNQQKLTAYFRAVLMTRVKTYIAQVMKEKKINIFEIDANLTDFSEDLHQLLIPDFAEYGVALERFFVMNIAKPDGDRQYEKFKEGYTYQQERGFDVAQQAAKNEATGQFTNMGIGLGAMAGIGKTVGSMVAGSIGETADSVRGEDVRGTGSECGNQTGTEEMRFCENCGYQFERPGKFCPKCGTKRG